MRLGGVVDRTCCGDLRWVAGRGRAERVEFSYLRAFSACSAAPPAPSPVSYAPDNPPLPHKFFSHAGQSLSCLRMVTTTFANLYSRVPSYLSRYGCCLSSLCAYAKDVLSVVSLATPCFSHCSCYSCIFSCVLFLARLRLAADPRCAAPRSLSFIRALALCRHCHPLLPDLSMACFLLYAPLRSR